MNGNVVGRTEGDRFLERDEAVAIDVDPLEHINDVTDVLVHIENAVAIDIGAGERLANGVLIHLLRSGSADSCRDAEYAVIPD